MSTWPKICSNPISPINLKRNFRAKRKKKILYNIFIEVQFPSFFYKKIQIFEQIVPWNIQTLLGHPVPKKMHEILKFTI